jgi:lysophospholipase L1-like esterase
MKNQVLAFTLCLPVLVWAGDAKKGAERWEKTIQGFEARDKKTPPPPNPVLLVGSSSFAMWRSAPDDLKPFTVINRGFGGSTLPDVLHYFDRVVVRYKPKLILVYEGDNDIAKGHTPERFLADVKTFVERVRKALPGTPVIFLTIKPSGRRWSMWEKMDQANKLIAQYAATQEEVETVDIGSVLLGKDGKPRDELFKKDRLHLNADGYKLWIEVLKPRIEKALKAAK